MEWINTNPINPVDVWSGEAIDKFIHQLASEYVDILNAHYKNAGNYAYAPVREVQKQMIEQEICYGLYRSQKGFTKESIFEYASSAINNFGMIKLMNEWYPKLEQLQNAYKVKRQFEEEYKHGQDTNTSSRLKGSWYSV